jgi:hypothetical protein
MSVMVMDVYQLAQRLRTMLAIVLKRRRSRVTSSSRRATEGHATERSNASLVRDSSEVQDSRTDVSSGEAEEKDKAI